ncbi:MAG: hypothetical protein DMC62_06175 [Verrucomicrobia bacterium]|nr:MAG: hypothetical protein DMC62_06175 [Verrucomicrobiota bacterium]
MSIAAQHAGDSQSDWSFPGSAAEDWNVDATTTFREITREVGRGQLMGAILGNLTSRECELTGEHSAKR